MKTLNKRFITVLLISMITVVFISASKHTSKDCSKALKHASDAQRHFKDAKNAKNIKDLHNSAKKGMDAATDAEIAAEKSTCDCDAAEQAAQNSYNHGKNAYKTDELELAKEYATKASNAAIELVSTLNTCSAK